jgi:predicted PurR-regulated permease PerM
MFKNLTFENIVKFLIGFAALSVIVLIVFNYLNLVAYALIAMLLSYLLDPVVNRMQAAGMNRTLAISITLSAVILLLAWISTSIIPDCSQPDGRARTSAYH